MRLLRFFTRRRLLLAAIVAAVERVFEPTVARADLFGGEDVVLSAILTQSIATVVQLVSALSTLKQQLDAMGTMLSQLGSASFDEVAALINNTDFSYAQLTKDVASIGYTLQSVKSQFRSLYASDYSKTSFSQFDALYGRWQDEILAATEVAARSQATLSTLQNNATEAAAILARSAGTDGQVAQMQATVQMLGLIQSQNNAIIQSLATTGRV